MVFQMIRVISSPSISTMGFLTLILPTGSSCSFALIRDRRCDLTAIAAAKTTGLPLLIGPYYSQFGELLRVKGKIDSWLILNVKIDLSVCAAVRCLHACQPRGGQGVTGRDWFRSRGLVTTCSLTSRRGKT